MTAVEPRRSTSYRLIVVGVFPLEPPVRSGPKETPPAIPSPDSKNMNLSNKFHNYITNIGIITLDTLNLGSEVYQ